VQNAANEVQLWAGAAPQVSGSHSPLVEGSGAVQPRLTAGGDTQPHYDVVAEESSLDNTFEDAEDEVIKLTVSLV